MFKTSSIPSTAFLKKSEAPTWIRYRIIPLGVGYLALAFMRCPHCPVIFSPLEQFDCLALNRLLRRNFNQNRSFATTHGSDLRRREGTKLALGKDDIAVG